MKFIFSSSRYGLIIYCPLCRTGLDQAGGRDSDWSHPTTEGLIFKKKSTCELAGKMFECPTVEMKEKVTGKVQNG